MGLSCSVEDLSWWAACELSVTAWRIKFPGQGLSPGPPALGAWSPSHWTPREARRVSFFSPQARRSAPALHLPLYYRHSVSGTPASEPPPQTAPGWTSQDPCLLVGPGGFTAGVAVMRGLAAGVLAAGCVDRTSSPGHTLGWRVSASPMWAGLASVLADWSPKRAIHHPQLFPESVV